MSQNIFNRLAPFVQDFIYKNNWQSLKEIQMAAADAIFNTDANVLLSASTASGKTEAAFFPILTLLSEEPSASVGCLYVAPLKALINDQFDRLNDLCDQAGINVWHWHGDVSQTQKKKLLKNPSGILQITPESLEAILIHHHAEIPRLFADLRFVVIDEIHSFLRSDRGGQMLCQLERIARLSGTNPRRVALSATIGDTKIVGSYLSAFTGRPTVIPQISSGTNKWRILMEHFFTTPPQASDTEPGFEKTKNEEDASLGHPAPSAADPALAYIFNHSRGKKCLVFSNSREECEAVTNTLRQYCEAVHEPDRFLIHHGNLSASYRESAEEIIKEEESLVTVCTTATLELGIDIGRLERAFQIDAPFTVSSFLQRMGRTGRRDLPSEMCFVMREEHAEQRALLPENIPWKLLQAIALVQLYVEERWVEPPRTGLLPYSLLFHQTMSILACGGEMSPGELAQKVLTLSYFKNISQDDFRTLLLHLIQTNRIEKTEGGGLIVGLEGERIVNNFKFYAVFRENEEYSVRCESEELGTIVAPPPVGDKIAIAGRTWVVDEVDKKRRAVYCTLVKGNVPAFFGQVAGDINTKILCRMHQVLFEKDEYKYLLPNAVARLRQARNLAFHASIVGKKASPLVCLGGKMFCLFPWLGSYAFLALERFLRLRCGSALGIKGFNSVRPYYIQWTMAVDEKEFFRIVVEEIKRPLDPMTLLFPKENPVFDKYDEELPDELLRRGFAFGVLDVLGMKDRVLEWEKFLTDCAD